MSSIIENSYAEFHNHPEIPFSDIVNENENFGIISLKIKKTNIINIPTLFLFTIDTTGSMDEIAYKRVTKLQVVKQTFRSMIHYLSKLETHVYIRVHSFNENVSVIIDNILISQDNVNEIIFKIDDLIADRSTNIGEALKQANETMKQYSSDNPTHQMVHIFMTDGEPTCGITNNNELTKIVDTSFTNNFIGFGLDHNAVLLKNLSELENSEYLFVDNMENTTLIYGELVHRYLYSAIKNAEIIIENGLIYDWKTNTWNTRLVEPVVVSEIEKIYHIKTTDINEVFIKLYGIVQCDNDTNKNLQLLDIIDVLPNLLQKNGYDNTDNDDGDFIEIVETPLYSDLSKYMFRQRTQELLFESKNECHKNVYEKQNFKNELKKLFKTMRNFMKQKDLLKDKFMITLCDDISIIYHSFGTEHGLMYTASRCTSQGRQQTYNVTPVKHNLQRSNAIYSLQEPPMLKRNNAGRMNPFSKEIPELLRLIERDYDDEEFDNDSLNNTTNIRMNNLTQEFIEDDKYFDMPPLLLNHLLINTDSDNEFTNHHNDKEVDNDIDNDIDIYELSSDITSCYATKSSLDTMRTMSQM
jgi:hypothetical protein